MSFHAARPATLVQPALLVRPALLAPLDVYKRQVQMSERHVVKALHTGNIHIFYPANAHTLRFAPQRFRTRAGKELMCDEHIARLCVDFARRQAQPHRVLIAVHRLCKKRRSLGRFDICLLYTSCYEHLAADFFRSL